MSTQKPLSAPRPPTRDEIVQKKRLATSILEHLIGEGLVTDLPSTQKAPYVETPTSEPQTEPDY